LVTLWPELWGSLGQDTAKRLPRFCM
jgi:hypothetical protein